jgi:hypothetical protein
MGGRTIALRQRMAKEDTDDEWTEFRIDDVATTSLPDRIYRTPVSKR